MFRATIACFLLATTPFLAEASVSNPMEIHEGAIHVISSFEKVDYFTTYKLTGDMAWEQTFNSVILSWRIENESILIFSRDRAGLAYYLTCFQLKTGEFLWEKAMRPPA